MEADTLISQNNENDESEVTQDINHDEESEYETEGEQENILAEGSSLLANSENQQDEKARRFPRLAIHMNYRMNDECHETKVENKVVKYEIVS